MPAHALLGAVVAVDEGGVGRPGVGALVLQLLTARIARCDAVLDLPVDCFPDTGLDLDELGGDLADVLGQVSVLFR